ncbi:MAG: M1 family aminopeptidase [Acidobacteriota bacterium]|jgi:aminopeptidase N
MVPPSRRGATLALVAVFALVWGAAAVPAGADTYPRQPGIDVSHYVFRLALSDESDGIEGEATVDVRVLTDGVTALVLDLARASSETNGHGMRVVEVSAGGVPLRFEHSADRLRIVLDPPGRRDERRRVTVRYHGVPASGLVIGPNRHGDRTFFSNNWPDRARQWLPVVDHPHDKATCEFVVTAPAHYQVVSNGLLVEETDVGQDRRRTHWRQSVPIAAWLYTLGVARFAVDHRPPWGGVALETWVYPQDRDKGFQVFAEPTVAALDFFSSRVGPYPYERLAHVQSNSVNGGMESATAIFYGDESATGERRERWRGIIIHEIAHQWWGNAVTESDWDDVWLSEGFATYFTHLFIEHAKGRDAFLAGLRADREAIRAFDDEHPSYRIVHDNLADMRQVITGPGTYKKGSWTLHMLRGVIGDTAFWDGIRDFYRRHRDGNASTADLRRAMEQASGRELGWFFDQWLRRGGMPTVRGRWAHDADSRMLRLDLEQAQPGPPFRLPIEVGLEIAGEEDRRLERIEVSRRRQSFSFPLERAPRSVVLDPRTFVLMDAKIVRAEATQ